LLARKQTVSLNYKTKENKTMEYENHFASKGVAGAGLGLGIAGTALGLLNGGLDGILGGRVNGCSEDHCVNRYEAGQQARIAELETEVKLRDANTYTDAKILDLYRYVDGKFNGVEAQICHQNVVNAQVAANISCMQNNIATLNGLTKTVIPIDNVCPEPMQRYNSWVAPTAPATAG
jgi:hypothetical protein